MKTPCLALHLVAATLVAAPCQAQADAFHSSPVLAGTMVGYAKPLSSDPRCAPTWCRFRHCP